MSTEIDTFFIQSGFINIHKQKSVCIRLTYLQLVSCGCMPRGLRLRAKGEVEVTEGLREHLDGKGANMDVSYFDNSQSGGAISCDFEGMVDEHVHRME